MRLILNESNERKVIHFPEKAFILRCRHCKINAFYVILNSDDPSDFKYYECCECRRIFIPDERRK